MEGRREKVRKLKLTWSTCCLLGQSHKCFNCERNSYSQITSVNIGFQWPYTQAMPNDFEVKSTIAVSGLDFFYVCVGFRCAGVTRGWDDGWMVGLPGI